MFKILTGSFYVPKSLQAMCSLTASCFHPEYVFISARPITTPQREYPSSCDQSQPLRTCKVSSSVSSRSLVSRFKERRPLSNQLVSFHTRWLYHTRPYWIHTDLHWYTLIYPDLHWFTLIYPDLHWSTLIYADLHWSTPIYSDPHWSTMIYADLHCRTKILPAHWRRRTTLCASSSWIAIRY
jgi:hypothetical protein